MINFEDVKSVTSVGGWSLLATIGVRWVLGKMRSEARSDASESMAVKLLRSEVIRLGDELKDIRIALANQDDLLERRQEALDEERELRRKAENLLHAANNELQTERYHRAQLTKRVAYLEQRANEQSQHDTQDPDL
jgi:ElaB/YqjD/DUF883 family membrane-anchored ribosome-binding protein